jgi:hypothetical protein
VRDIQFGSSTQSNTLIQEFALPIQNFFFSPDSTGGEGVMNAFISIAFGIKNIFIALAVFFLIIAIIKLIFSAGGDENIKKWKSNIIWVSAGIFVMQIAFSVWNTLLIKDTTRLVDSTIAWQIWNNVLLPIVSLLQLLAWLGFLLMSIYSFYIIITGAGDEERLKKWKRTIIYGLVGFALIQFPRKLVELIYGAPNCKNSGYFSFWSCEIRGSNIEWVVALIGKILNYANSFIAIISVFLVLYSGWLIFSSAGDDEKMKKAKSILLYLAIGFVLLIASNALFRFFLVDTISR